MVEEARWKFKAPTHNGGRSSNTEVTNSSMSKTRRYLMLKEPKMRKHNQLLSTRATLVRIKDGTSFILIKQRRFQPKATMKNSDSISIDHSISDQECQ